MTLMTRGVGSISCFPALDPDRYSLEPLSLSACSADSTSFSCASSACLKSGSCSGSTTRVLGSVRGSLPRPPHGIGLPMLHVPKPQRPSGPTREFAPKTHVFGSQKKLAPSQTVPRGQSTACSTSVPSPHGS